ncbi:hypothetical protein L6267_00070 [Candidatus Parcubacteria bacterium]|nr:hypothetical protein [Candidatus Parcubacteria bacterium]
MPENLLQKKEGLQDDGDLGLRLRAQRLLDKFCDDCSTNVVGKRIIGDQNLELEGEAKE